MASIFSRMKLTRKKYGHTKQRRHQSSATDEDERVALFTSLSDEEEEEINTENLELEARQGQERTEFITRDILPGESLYSIALRYRCPVAELKRANKLIADGEFFALRQISIPVRPFSVLSELIPNDVARTAGASCASGSNDDSDAIMRTVSIHSTNKQEAARFLRYMDQDLQHIREKTLSYKSSLVEVTHALTTPMFFPLREPRPGICSCSGTDGGLTWWKLLFIVFIVALLAPIVYIIKLSLSRDSS